MYYSLYNQPVMIIIMIMLFGVVVRRSYRFVVNFVQIYLTTFSFPWVMLGGIKVLVEGETLEEEDGKEFG